MIFGVALEVLRKQSNCWDKITECSAKCEECECHVDASNLVEAVKTVLDNFPTQMSGTPNSSTKFKPGSKFLLEIGEKCIGLDEYSIVGTDLYVWGSLLEKLTPYEADGDLISRQAAIDAVAKALKGTFVEYEDIAEKIINKVPPVQAEQKWIPCSERLPENFKPVIVTWKNNDPASYYQYIVGKHFIGVAHYKNDTWYWYSSVTEDFLAEYGKYESEEFDEAIEVIAWMPLPEPYRGDNK